MAKLKRPSIGDLIALPIENKFAIGLVVRINNDKIPLGNFYGKLFSTIPESIDELKIDFAKPILIKEFGSQGLRDGTWKIIGTLPNFKKQDFPVPVFYTHTKPFKPQLVYFDDNMNEIKRISIEESEAVKYTDYPETGLSGSGFIEKRLERIIIGKSYSTDASL
jgi:Immunity protein 26